MSIKTILVKVTLEANTTIKQLDKLVTPAGRTRRYKELRAYFSATGNAGIIIKHQRDVIMEIDPNEWNAHKLPYPMDEEVGGEDYLVIEGFNSESSDISVVLCFIYEE